jgi:hypothetical protein
MKIYFLSIMLLASAKMACAQFSEETYAICDQKVFTQVEILPDFKNGKAAFEDSLSQELKRKNSFPQKGVITYAFIVTMQSRLVDLNKENGEVLHEEAIRKALMASADQWTPAKQNAHTVCAYIYLTLNFSKNKLETKVFQKGRDD